jgi:hypothetical protein
MIEDTEETQAVPLPEIDDRPNPAHRVRLRWQILTTFNTTRREDVTEASARHRVRRTIMSSRTNKATIAAVLTVAGLIGLYLFTAGARSNDSGLVTLHTDLPRPMFQGTKQDIRVENLRKPDFGSRPPFLVPLGTTNVALGKPISASDEEPIIGDLEMITDGDKEAADGSFVELGPFLQHVTIDLQAMHNIYAIAVWHYHKEPTVYFDVVVQIADDQDFTQNVQTLFNNDIDNSAGLGAGGDMHYVETYKGELIDARGHKARYVRLYSNGNKLNDLNHYVEVEVFGKPVE